MAAKQWEQLPVIFAVEILGRLRAYGNCVLDLLTKSSPAGVYANQGMPTTPGGIVSTGTNQQQPGAEEGGSSFAELLLAGGPVEVDGNAVPAVPGGTSATNQPFLKNQKKADNSEAQASPVSVLCVLEGLIPPLQFSTLQASESGAGSGQGDDDPTRNAGVEPYSGDVLALTTELFGETDDRPLGSVGESDASWTGSGAIEEEAEDTPADTPSAQETKGSDSGTSARPLSNPLPSNRDLELPAATPVGPKSDSAISNYPLEPVQSKSVAAGSSPPKIQESGGANGRVSHRDVSQTESSPGPPAHRFAEAAGTAQTNDSVSTILAAPKDSSAPVETVFGLLVARGNGNTDTEAADIPAREGSDTGGKLEPTEEQGPSDGSRAELPRYRQAGPESKSGDQYTPERFRQPGELGGLGLSSPPTLAFSFFSDGGASAEPQTEQVWSRLDGGAIPPDPHNAAPAQPLTSMNLPSTGLERISVRVLESRGGLEVQVATLDTVAKQDLLGGLDELAGRVRELSLGTVIPGREGPDPGQDFQRGNRQHQSNREDWRPRAKKSGVAFALPIGSVGEHLESKPVRRT